MNLSLVHSIQNPTLSLYLLSNIYRAPVVCVVTHTKDTGQGGEAEIYSILYLPKIYAAISKWKLPGKANLT